MVARERKDLKSVMVAKEPHHLLIFASLYLTHRK
jgi:hypothetical protein